jgi:nicotinamidase-related amidase
MPFDIKPLIAPVQTAVLTNEVQSSVVHVEGDLAENARAILGNIVALAEAAREVGSPVVHAVKIFRRDSLARNRNIVLYQRRNLLPDADAPPPEADHRAQPGCHVVSELGPDERDLVMTRLHGMGSVYDGGIDPVLRTLGVSTVIVTGVSLNVGVPNTVMDLVNRGYDVVVPDDAVAGTPMSYKDQIMENTIKFLARVVSTEQILAAWRS